ncbi:hypothetical protein AYI70_g8748 [Smittium culicis]|uniref:Uncharacterized protein n=1 Tax=Smittium culicis TaxID=133412 RepID=A0A1R1XEJ0_9FUNG|nr:hypothetical protein AYI70_g8748 [Smittium culicis]
MSEYFYRTMLTDEEENEEIYGFPKSSKVCYNPPPINEAAFYQFKLHWHIGGAHKGVGNGFNRSPSPEHRVEEAKNTFKEIGTEQQGFLVEPIKSFCRSGPLDDADGNAPTKIASSAIQVEAQPRGPPGPDGGGGIPTNKEGHRGGGESEPRILQQFILHSKEDGRATIGIGSKETEPASRGKELQDGIPFNQSAR